MPERPKNPQEHSEHEQKKPRRRRELYNEADRGLYLQLVSKFAKSFKAQHGILPTRTEVREALNKGLIEGVPGSVLEHGDSDNFFRNLGIGTVETKPSKELYSRQDLIDALKAAFEVKCAQTAGHYGYASLSVEQRSIIVLTGPEYERFREASPNKANLPDLIIIRNRLGKGNWKKCLEEAGLPSSGFENKDELR